jgi:aldehyde:ferredoxin oxidoreductase
MQVKAIEYGAHGVRARRGERSYSPRYAIATQGGDHESTAGPAYERNYFNDSLVLCHFWSETNEERLQLLNAATGSNVTQEELETVLLPRWTTQQWVPLLMAGWTHEDNTNAPRCFEPLPTGPYKGYRVNKAEEQKLVQEAYDVRGYDRRGIPTSETLENLGLSYADELLRPYRRRRSG